MADARRISEAKEHIEAAEKSLKTSFFKWKPDFGSAAHEYEQAAICLKNAKQPLEAKRAYINAAGAHRNNDALFHAAKQYEHAAFIMRDLKDWGEVMGLFEKAASLYTEHGTPDTAAICLEKAAKMMETVNPRMSLELYQKACDVVELEDRPRQIVDFLGKSARILIKIQDYDEASKILSRERDLRRDLGDIDATNRTVSALVLVHLKRGDYVAADKICNIAMGFEGYAESDVASALACLLDAYDKQDEDTFHQILNLPLFKYMDNVYVILAKSLRVPGGSRPKPKKAAAAAVPAGEMGPVGGAEGGDDIVDEDDDDEEFDLK